MTDRDKFYAWLVQCPVTVRKVDDGFAHGVIELLLQLPDERDDDEDQPAH
jgi:hypothetical protein